MSQTFTQAVIKRYHSLVPKALFDLQFLQAQPTGILKGHTLARAQHIISIIDGMLDQYAVRALNSVLRAATSDLEALMLYLDEDGTLPAGKVEAFCARLWYAARHCPFSQYRPGSNYVAPSRFTSRKPRTDAQREREATQARERRAAKTEARAAGNLPDVANSAGPIDLPSVAATPSPQAKGSTLSSVEQARNEQLEREAHERFMATHGRGGSMFGPR